MHDGAKDFKRTVAAPLWGSHRNLTFARILYAANVLNILTTEFGMSGESTERSPRVLFLSNVQTYRAAAFWEAGQALGIECHMAVDMEEELAASSHYGWGFPFAQTERAVERIVAAHAQSPWSAILALDDVGSAVAACSCQVLGLPHNSPAAAWAARDKHEMRRRLDAGGLACPAFIRVKPDDDLHGMAQSLGFPLVLKPLDRNGSQGVMRVNDPAELTPAIARVLSIIQGGMEGPRPSFLMERYIPGIEFAVEAIITGQELQVLAIFDKPDPLEGPFFEESIYVTPSRASEANQRRIRKAVQQAARALGLGFGPVHAELRLNDQGAWIIEVAGRSIGGLCSRTLRFGRAESLESLILRQACGLPMPDLNPTRTGSGVMMIPIPEAGIFQGVEGLGAASRVTGITGIEITAQTGYTLKPLPEGNSYLGFIFAEAPSPQRAEQALRQAYGCLTIRMQPEIALTAI